MVTLPVAVCAILKGGRNFVFCSSFRVVVGLSLAADSPNSRLGPHLPQSRSTRLNALQLPKIASPHCTPNGPCFGNTGLLIIVGPSLDKTTHLIFSSTYC